MAGPGPARGQLLPPAAAPRGQTNTALLDALIARGLANAAGSQALESATPLEGYPQVPNPDPNSAPPLYGEPPGEGYLYPHDPEFRQATLVSTSPDMVRAMILRAMEVAATAALLPFDEEGAAKKAEALLKMAQAYLLIDPAVDSEGVPVAGKMLTQAGGQIAVQAGKPAAGPAGAGAAAKPAAKAGGGAHGTVKRAPPTGGHQEPPRVLAGHAAQMLQEMHANAENVLKGSRASRPLPRPRPGS